MNIIKSNIKYLCKINKIKIKDLEKELNIKNRGLSRVYFYKNVKLSQLESIAHKFSIPLNVLVYVDLTKDDKTQIYDLIAEEIIYERNKPSKEI